jgi:hypothetical protein
LNIAASATLDYQLNGADHQYSHLTRSTIFSATSFEEQAFYIGASFDAEKVHVYDSEINSRIGLAEVFGSVIAAVRMNIAKW